MSLVFFVGKFCFRKSWMAKEKGYEKSPVKLTWLAGCYMFVFRDVYSFFRGAYVTCLCSGMYLLFPKSGCKGFF